MSKKKSAPHISPEPEAMVPVAAVLLSTPTPTPKADTKSAPKIVLVNLINGSPVMPKDRVEKLEAVSGSPVHHRDNTAWFCQIPNLGISMILRDNNGHPITGWLDLPETKRRLRTNLLQAFANETVMQSMVQTKEFYSELDVNSKVMTIKLAL